MPGLLAIVDAFFAPVLEELQPGAATAVRASQRADLQVDGVLAVSYTHLDVYKRQGKTRQKGTPHHQKGNQYRQNGSQQR